MSQQLPPRANLEWLKKLCKERLAAQRAGKPDAKLSQVQIAVAREYGFPSWRKLKAHVELLRDVLDEPPTVSEPPAASDEVPADDPELAQLLAACWGGDFTVVAPLLVRRPALARAYGPGGSTPLHVAAQCNDPRLAVILLAAGADPKAKYGGSGHTPLSWAVTCNSIECAKTLVEHGSKLDFFCAAGMGAIEDVHAFFNDDGSLRPGASQTGSSRVAPDGTRLPCPPQSSVELISDALYFACRNGHAEVARYLLDRGADLSFRGYMGGTALHWAYFSGSRPVIEMLEKAGADGAARDDSLKCTPRAFGICAPSNWGFLELVRRRLVEDLSLANFMDGRTSPLHEAARGGHLAIVQLLLKAGADRELRDGDGKTALEIATAGGHTGIAELLRTGG